MSKLILTLLSLIILSNSFSQTESQFSYRVEDFKTDDKFLVENAELVRYNGGEVTKRGLKRFNKLNNKGINVDFWHFEKAKLPEEFEAFGRVFSTTEETDYTKTYVSNEIDSERQYIKFKYLIYTDFSALQMVEIESENIRSGEIRLRYLYQFWETRSR